MNWRLQTPRATVLTLALNAEYFDAIKRGEKTEEYRKRTDYWRRRLEMRDYDRLVLTRGYPKKGDPERTLVFPWRGYLVTTITHPHFGDRPTEVFAIILTEATQ